ncbi:MAG: acyl carrier protein [Bacteroidales bacterium]|jgi:acyl carrier protein|nr:acyl carrier protein [Bacteroidales bacterium]
MKREDIITIINDFLIDELEIDREKLQDDANLKNDLGIDSLDFVDIVVIVEHKFGIKISPEEITNVPTLKAFYDYIERKTGVQ